VPIVHPCREQTVGRHRPDIVVRLDGLQRATPTHDQPTTPPRSEMLRQGSEPPGVPPMRAGPGPDLDAPQPAGGLQQQVHLEAGSGAVEAQRNVPVIW
jgi:hypothetical protein